jgi:hypothetical protein
MVTNVCHQSPDTAVTNSSNFASNSSLPSHVRCSRIKYFSGRNYLYTASK